MIEQGRVFQDNDEPLAKEVREHIFDHRTRAHYVDSARTYLRNKTLMFETTYDVVVVGAGIHAAMFVYTAKQANPDLKILIVEKRIRFARPLQALRFVGSQFANVL